jgi:single-stranded DNA-specific DHH superfamily exonuclease
MLTEKQIKEIKEHLNKAQNPLFFFDNDADGLCGFLLLQRFIGRGKGVSIKSFPNLDVSYFRRVRELNPDYIFILDKALVSEEFFQEAHKYNIPVVWIDHHEPQEVPEFVSYYNPYSSESETAEAVSAFCYQINNKKEDLWLAVVGCISDAFIPDFYPEFRRSYPELSIESKNVLDIYYGSEIGKIAQILGFALKDRTSNVVFMLKYLMKVKSPNEVLEENRKNYTIHKRFNEINKKYQTLLKKAKIIGDNSKKILFFQYSGDLSISSDLANALRYKFPDKIIVVAYISGVKVNVSVRGNKIKDVVLKAIKDLKDSTGGGHEEAVGAKIKVEDLEIFKKKLNEFIK